MQGFPADVPVKLFIVDDSHGLFREKKCRKCSWFTPGTRPWRRLRGEAPEGDFQASWASSRMEAAGGTLDDFV